MPVPPVVMIACTSGCASWRSIVPRTSSGSSLTIVRPATAWPAAWRSETMVSPLVSLASVRVSLTVITKHRTDAGAFALCSAWLTCRCYHPHMFRAFVAVLACAAIAAATVAPQADRDGAAWVRQTLASMTLDEKIGQLLVTSLNAAFTSSDSDAFDKLRHLVRDVKVGGIHMFGATESFPALLLNATYGNGSASRKG